MILREHRPKPQGLADLLNWAALVGEGIVVNKDGSFLAGWTYTGPDLDAATAEDLALLSQHFNQALLPLGDEWLLNADAVRRPSRDYPAPGPFPDPVSELLDEERREQYEGGRRNYETTYTLCVSWLPPDELQSSIARWFISGEDRKGPDWRAQVDSYADRLEDIEDRLSASLALTRLSSEALLTHLHTCLTGLYHRVAVPDTPCYLDVLLASQDLYGGFSPRIGDQHLRTISITGFPHESHPAMFDFLHRIPMEYRLSHRFLPLDPESAAKHIRLYRRNWWQKRKGLGGLIKEAITTDEKAADPKFLNRDAVRMAEDADEALAECLGGAVRYGFYTTTVVLMDEDETAVEDSARQVLKEIHNRGFAARIERVNALEAYRSSLPSHAHPNVRRPLISTINLADLLPTTSVWPGLPTNPCPFYPPGSPALLWAATSGSTPFRLNLHVSDVGHTLVLGPTGAGKSTLLGLIQAQFFRYPDAQVFTFDKGYSSFPLVAACGGHHYDIAAESLDSLAFYPLASIDQPGERAWAAEWVEILMALQGIVVTPAHRGAIDHALGLLAASPSRTLTDLQVKLQDPGLRQALRPYTLKGNFGALLDAQNDGLRDSRFQVFEMAHLMELGDRVVIPTLLYLFHRIQQRLDGRPTLIILEEAWTYLLHELFAERIQLWLKELRKYNAAVVFVTQSLADIHGSSKRHVIYESCPTKILLPNSEAGTEQGAAIYRAIGLNDREIEIVAQGVKKRDYYYSSPLGNRLMDLTLGPLAMAFVGATSREDLRAIQELRTSFGPEWPRAWVRQRGLDRWADQLTDSDEKERRRMRRLKQVLACIVLLTLVTAIATPPPAQAQFAVYDAINWIENATQVIQQVYEIYQKYMQLYNDYQRYATMLKNLERFDSLSFQNLVGLANAVNEIIQYGEALGHTLYDIDAQFAETFPGYEPILESDWLDIFSHRNRRTLDTLRYTLDALNRIASSTTESQAALQTLAGDVAGADGNLKALQANGELLHHQAGQLAEINQQLSLQTNAQAVFWAYQVDREASDRATASEWLANGVGEVPPYDDGRGARGVPADWPWPCYGCAHVSAEARR